MHFTYSVGVKDDDVIGFDIQENFQPKENQKTVNVPSDDVDQKKKKKKSLIREWQQDLKAFFGSGKKKKLDQKQKEDNKAKEEKNVDSTSQSKRHCFQYHNVFAYLFLQLQITYQILKETILIKKIC